MKKIKTVVLDIGTCYLKCGFAGDSQPSCIASSTPGNPIHKTGCNQTETSFGRNLQKSSVPLTISPVRHDLVVDWNCVQDTLELIFQREIKIQPEDYAVLVSVPPLCSTTYKERYAEMIFERLHMPAIYTACQFLLSMYSYGKTSALVVESGHGTSHVVPIYEGYAMSGIIGSVDYAGLAITRFLMKLLNQSGNMITEHQLHVVQDLKDRYCYASLDFAKDLSLPVQRQQTDYQLPDGHLITVGKERFLCAEALFRPSLCGLQHPGLSQLTLASFKKCDAEINQKMMQNILLCGGSTMMEGFVDRFQMDLAKMCPSDNLTAVASPQRKFSVWIGGSILASLHSFQDLWVYRSDYEEHGPSCIFKCF